MWAFFKVRESHVQSPELITLTEMYNGRALHFTVIYAMEALQSCTNYFEKNKEIKQS